MAQSKVSTKSKVELNFPERYDVIFHNDDFTPMDFVIQLLIEVFNKGLDTAKDLTMQIHTEGKAVAGTYSYEIAEQKVNEAMTLSRYNKYPLKVTMETLS